MKAISLLSLLFILVFERSGKEKAYAASTPADALVKRFLAIPLTDSIDYIEWKILLRDNDYTIHCHYKIETGSSGVSNNNRTLEFLGKLSKDENFYILHNQNNTLKLAILNENLLHISHADNSLLVGNGGWSYTINSVHLINANGLSVKVKPTAIKDSIVFVGRTPCGVPGVVREGVECFKLKWKIVFYGSSRNNQPARCVVYATPYRKEGSKQGTWKMHMDTSGRIRYILSDEKGKPFLYLEKADENILLFTDPDGKILTGDKDYSFTLNRSA